MSLVQIKVWGIVDGKLSRWTPQYEEDNVSAPLKGKVILPSNAKLEIKIGGLPPQTYIISKGKVKAA